MPTRPRRWRRTWRVPPEEWYPPPCRRRPGTRPSPDTIERRPVDQTVAREIARLKHVGQSTRFGESVFAHVQRVADRVAPEACNAALLHEIFELTPVSRAELQARGLSRPELAALRLLTHR